MNSGGTLFWLLNFVQEKDKPDRALLVADAPLSCSVGGLSQSMVLTLSLRTYTAIAEMLKLSPIAHIHYSRYGLIELRSKGHALDLE